MGLLIISSGERTGFRMPCQQKDFQLPSKGSRALSLALAANASSEVARLQAWDYSHFWISDLLLLHSFTFFPSRNVWATRAIEVSKRTWKIMQYQWESCAAAAQKPSSHANEQRWIEERTPGVLDAVQCSNLQLVYSSTYRKCAAIWEKARGKQHLFS